MPHLPPSCPFLPARAHLHLLTLQSLLPHPLHHLPLPCTCLSLPPSPALTFPFQLPYGTHASVIGGSFKGRFIRAAAYLLPSGGNWEAVRWVMAASSPTRGLPITSQRLPPTYRFAFSLHPFPFIALLPPGSPSLYWVAVFRFPSSNRFYLSYGFPFAFPSLPVAVFWTLTDLKGAGREADGRG